MTTPNREQNQNTSSTTLNGSHNNSTTAIAVTTGSVFPSSGNFRVKVDSEIMLVTARSSNTLTVVRGQDGTSAASHADLAPISMIVDTQSLIRTFQDNDPLFGHSSRKPQGQLFADDGVTVLTASGFTWQNQGGATVTDENGTVVMSCPTDANKDVRIQELSAPSTPYTYIGAFDINIPASDGTCSPFVGMGFRESSSSKLILISTYFNGSSPGWAPKISVDRYTDPSTFSATSRGPQGLQVIGDHVWFKIENDGTNLKYYVSMDGTAWILYFSESKTAFFSGNPDKVFWAAGNNNNSGSPAVACLARLHHWSKGE